MTDARKIDQVVVGSGPNGLAAAILLAQNGRRVHVIEGKDQYGGGVRSAELTLPGFVHDVCAGVHPLGEASPFFRSLPLRDFGLEWVYPPYAVAHPLDDGSAVIFERDLAATARNMGTDAAAYMRLIGWLARRGDMIVRQFLGPMRFPERPIPFALFGIQALLPALTLGRLAFRSERARAAFAGMSAHSMLPLNALVTGGFGLMISLMAHYNGYPIARGGSQRIVDALVGYLRSLGGTLEAGNFIEHMDDLPPSRQVLFDLTPRQIVAIAGERFPEGYRHRLNGFRYGVGVYKVDYALDGPIPWKAKECGLAGTVHLGGTMEEIAASERAAWQGRHSDQPFVLLAQQSLFDDTRAPKGKHTVWAYCHVPNGSTTPMYEPIEQQIERFAPGFCARIVGRHVTNAQDMQRYNPNYIGGDINGGVQDIRQFFTRPVARIVPYSTAARGIYICSSSTPPGGGVHGMCGYYAARAALRGANLPKSTRH